MAKRAQEIKEALLRQIFWQSGSPASVVAQKFGVTVQAVQLHLRDLTTRGQIIARGVKRYRRYHLAELDRHQRSFLLGSGVTEDSVWASFVSPLLGKLNREENGICHYGLTEMFNNVIDHSSGTRAVVRVSTTAVSTTIQITDNGRGIFDKISQALGLTDPREALIELSKGKFTTDPRRHTGEGIFFSSQLFDQFRILSGALAFSHSSLTDDWLVETADRKLNGTRVTMALLVPSTTVMQEVFSRFSSGPDEYRFAKTRVPLKLATFGDESLLSRSSAKRVLTRVETFDEVLMDFLAVRSIGQAFADEIFRVFANAHPKVQLIAINANAQVTQMIRRAQSARDQHPPIP